MAWACAFACAALLDIAQGFSPPSPVPSTRRPRACTMDLVSGVRMQADRRQAVGEQQNGANGVDPAYPYLFDGRLWFRPAIVRVPDLLPAGVAPISLFGYRLGLRFAGGREGWWVRVGRWVGGKRMAHKR